MTCNHLAAALCAVVLSATASAQSTTWQPLQPSSPFTPQPGVRRCAAMAYDTARDRIVLVSGRMNIMGSNVYPQETWEFDGVDWQLIGPVGPVAYGGYNSTTNVCAYYDSQRQVTVAVESRPQGPTNFFEWSGSGWSLALSVPQPNFTWRYDFDVVYDPVRGVGVLFGGTNGSVHHGDTWEFDGTNFVQVSGFGPQPRWGHAMAYDETRGVVVMYGGRGNQFYTDMWDWDGSSWQPTPNATGPGQRTFHELVYDRDRARLVLIGTESSGANDTWEWQASSGWTLTTATQLARSNMAAIYDDQRGRVVMFGGAGNQLPLLPSATFGYGEASATAAISSFGTGCAGPSGVTVLQANDLPVLGTQLNLELTNVPNGPINLVFGWLGFDNQTWNGVSLPAALDPVFPGCSAYLAPQASYPLGTSLTGTVAWQIGIPFVPAIDGAPFYLQGGVLVLGFNPGGVVFTNALAGTIGL